MMPKEILLMLSSQKNLMTKIWPIPIISILNQGFSLEEIGICTRINGWSYRKKLRWLGM